MRYFLLNPLWLFLFFWSGILLVDFFYVDYTDSFYSLGLETYTSIFICFICWWTGYLLGKLVPKQLFFIKVGVFKSINSVVNWFLFFMILYIVFMMIDHYLIVGGDFYTSLGLSLYRLYLTEEGGSVNFPLLSLLNYFFFFCPTLLVALIFFENKVANYKKILLIIFYILFVYFSTARSSFFVSMLIAFFFLLHIKFEIRYIIIMFLSLFLFFGLIGELVGKPGFDKFWFYLLSPLHAFDLICREREIIDIGLLSWRFLHFILVKLEVIDHALTKIPYILTPKPTNVFTVFGVYYLDYGFLGLCVSMVTISFFSSVFYFSALYRNTLRSNLFSSLSLSLIVLSVFYDYYTSSAFVYLFFVYVFFFFPSGKCK
ncbi:O-antigen polymerase [Zooshikella sp. RANM57]|uniref:O-antigen polymerase n=1 Tax=Zooshikella sp. RANM57 TaxID=3425863 RepID=UPI003D6E1B30